MLLAIDPGMNSPGAALFLDNTLFRAGRVPIPAKFAELPDGARWLAVGHSITQWAGTAGGANSIEPRLIRFVVFEKPQVYSERQGKSKGDPNQLISVAGVAAATLGVLSMIHDRGVTVLSPTPGEWIGQLPKVCQVCKGKAKKKCKACEGSAWKTPRGIRIRSRLTPAELALVPDQNDAIDAVGIGLWALGRLERHCVFSNGKDGR